mmetsp:Transcript_4306/g.10716  ORF Transcript_4306/g.10716 Transcript_4306/m.10716 type:complete len:305 (-) Transcript_4306:1896-2810(-)
MLVAARTRMDASATTSRASAGSCVAGITADAAMDGGTPPLINGSGGAEGAEIGPSNSPIKSPPRATPGGGDAPVAGCCGAVAGGEGAEGADRSPSRSPSKSISPWPPPPPPPAATAPPSGFFFFFFSFGGPSAGAAGAMAAGATVGGGAGAGAKTGAGAGGACVDGFAAMPPNSAAAIFSFSDSSRGAAGAAELTAPLLPVLPPKLVAGVPVEKPPNGAAGAGALDAPPELKPVAPHLLATPAMLSPPRVSAAGAAVMEVSEEGGTPYNGALRGASCFLYSAKLSAGPAGLTEMMPATSNSSGR